MRNPNYINGSGYYCPTEGEAIDHIIHDERKKAKAERRKQDANHKRKLQNSNTNKPKRGR
jgi:hypothetical protein